jgi:hypothetical protein
MPNRLIRKCGRGGLQRVRHDRVDEHCISADERNPALRVMPTLYVGFALAWVVAKEAGALRIFPVPERF